MELFFLKKEEKDLELENINACLKEQEQLCEAIVYVSLKNRFQIVRIVDGSNIVGYIFFRISYNGICDIDIGINHKHRYQGYAVEALKLLGEKFKNDEKVRELSAYIAFDNLASRRCFEKCSFNIEEDESDDIVVRYIKSL